MTGAVVIWTKDWSDAPIIAPELCKHPGSAALAIGLTVDRTRGRGTIAMKASVCMLCGIDSTGNMAPALALQAAWQEHGWHRATGERLMLLAQIEGAST